jgi:hypothetical protein
MDINNRLFVEIHPFEGNNAPHPDPIRDARFDPSYVYKVLGIYNASETSECYFILANPARQIWFIPQRHLLAYKLLDSDEFFLPLQDDAVQKTSRWRNGSTPPRNADHDSPRIGMNPHE